MIPVFSDEDRETVFFSVPDEPQLAVGDVVEVEDVVRVPVACITGKVYRRERRKAGCGFGLVLVGYRGVPHGPSRQERILCAAIYVDTGEAKPPRRSHTYPATGLVFAGWRHPDCFTTLNAWADRLTDEERARIGAEALRGRCQGFVTSRGRFVDREEGARIAVAAGQVPPGIVSLDSEQVYPPSRAMRGQ